MGKGKEKCIDPLWPAELYPTAGQGGKVGGEEGEGRWGGVGSTQALSTGQPAGKSGIGEGEERYGQVISHSELGDISHLNGGGISLL